MKFDINVILSEKNWHTSVASLMIALDRLYLDSPSEYLPEKKNITSQDEAFLTAWTKLNKLVIPLKRFKRASVGPLSGERYFPESIPIARGL